MKYNMSILDNVQKNIDDSGLLRDLEVKLKAHDWYYFMSEDPKVNAKGLAQKKEIDALMSQISEMGLEQEAQDLYKKYQKSVS